MTKKESAKKIPALQHSVSDSTPIDVVDLYLDPHNPRLAGKHLSLEDQPEILRVLWQERAVNELVASIAANGYWQHEVLFATPEAGSMVVIEGNRRLAAVKLLTDQKMRLQVKASGVPSISQAAKERLKKLPVIVCTRRDVWDYIGFKHVNGPQNWDSIAKAQYIARVHNDYGISLNEIASTIGDQNNTVKRLYRGLMVLEQAEKAGVFSRDDLYGPRFSYSHLWTGLGYAGIQKFVGMSAETGFTPHPVPKSKLNNLGDLMLWLYGSKQQGKQPIIRSQNPDLRTLDEVVRTERGISSLKAGLPLETSLKASRGDERLLKDAMWFAEWKLREAAGLVVTGYHGEPELLITASKIKLLSESIHADMEEKATPTDDDKGEPKKQRRTK